MHARLQRYVVPMVFCAMGLFSISSSPAAQENTDKKKTDDYELMKFFVETFEQIDRSYVKDIDRRELIEAAVRGMLGTLDQYSSYISPDDIARFTQQVEQQFGGIGIQVTGPPRVKRLTVISPLPGTPAYKAGVRAGDVIMEIDGKSTEGLKLPQVVKLLKGKPGDSVTIGVLHAGSNKIEQVKIVRAIIQVSTVLGDRYAKNGKWEFMLDDKEKIGYIRLTHFSRRSTDELRTALNGLKSAGMKALILDLRTNPGGLLSQATEISDLFVDEGKIVSTKGRNSRERAWTAKKTGTFTGFPMAVLVNGFSASASEIVSACLQDHKRAVIVGQRTWGKGSVQNVIELESGGSALKLTTASYHRPSGKNIHRFPGAKDTDEWGVKPDKGYEVTFPLEEMKKYHEYRQARDVLRKEGPPKSDFKDRQLEKALEYVRGRLGTSEAAEKKKTEDAKDPDPANAKKPKAAAEAPSGQSKELQLTPKLIG